MTPIVNQAVRGPDIRRTDRGFIAENVSRSFDSGLVALLVVE